MTGDRSDLPPIAVAEDSHADLALLQHYLQLAGVRHPLVALSNGEELIEYLKPLCDPAGAATSVRPCLVFLDINMPKVDGFTALEWIRQQPALKTLPVVALSGAIEPKDLSRAARLGLARFVTKYPPPQVFAEIVTQFSSPR
jgi:CheY-like chemotaxis protein